MSNLPRVLFLRSARRGAEVTVDDNGNIRLPAGGPAGAEADATDTAASIIDQAHDRSDELLREAADHAVATRREAYLEGHDLGHRAGQADARAELAETLALVQQVAAAAMPVRDRLLQSVEREIVELVLDAVRTVLGERAQVDRQLVLTTVERALKRAGALTVVRIRVNPADQEVVSASVLEENAGGDAAWEVTADGAVGVGGCIIDTAHGQIDARLDVQLDEVARVLRETVPGDPPTQPPDEAVEGQSSAD